MMTKAEGDRAVVICQTVAENMKEDAQRFDGRPFNGQTVAQYFGNQGAAISALANVLRALLESAIAREG